MSVTILGPLSPAGIKLALFDSLASMVADEGSRQASIAEMIGVQGTSTYAVHIGDDSMSEAGIFKNDLVVVDRSVYAEHGDIVVAVINSEKVCKRLHLRGEVVILESGNSAYPPRYVTQGDELVIWGVVKHSIRNLA